MGKIIRRTVTITFTETWTIVWASADESNRWLIGRALVLMLPFS